MESKPLPLEHGLLDLELEHGLREICSLIQRKVIDPANARKDAQGVETAEMRLQQ
jgi:hypothetical protein